MSVESQGDPLENIPVSRHVRVEFAPGEVIFAEGEQSECLYILEEGEIEVVRGDEVVSSIKDKRTFFGEMSFLMKRERTSTLRAKDHVVAYRIDQNAEDSFESRLATASINLMKVMATRLDLANREVRRLGHYEQFYLAMKELSSKSKESSDLFKLVEKEVDLKEISTRDHLLSNYLNTPWVWTRLESSIFEILQFYSQDELKVDRVEAWRPQDLLGTACAIPFSGDRDGLVILDLDDALSEMVQHGMGITEGEYRQETTEEMSNQILGQLKRKVSEHAIQLGTPTALASMGDLEALLAGQAALKIEVSSNKGALRLIYQLK